MVCKSAKTRDMRTGKSGQIVSTFDEIQKEATGLTILGVPCMTLRENTERAVTITEWTNMLAYVSDGNIVRIYRKIREGNDIGSKRPKLWDGKGSPENRKNYR